MVALTTQQQHMYEVDLLRYAIGNSMRKIIPLAVLYGWPLDALRGRRGSMRRLRAAARWLITSFITHLPVSPMADCPATGHATRCHRLIENFLLKNEQQFSQSIGWNSVLQLDMIVQPKKLPE
jgi:hypothetical protein